MTYTNAPMHFPRVFPRPVPACELSLISAGSPSNINMSPLNMSYEPSNGEVSMTLGSFAPGSVLSYDLLNFFNGIRRIYSGLFHHI